VDASASLISRLRNGWHGSRCSQCFIAANSLTRLGHAENRSAMDWPWPTTHRAVARGQVSHELVEFCDGCSVGTLPTSVSWAKGQPPCPPKCHVETAAACLVAAATFSRLAWVGVQVSAQLYSGNCSDTAPSSDRTCSGLAMRGIANETRSAPALLGTTGSDHSSCRPRSP